MKRCGRCKETKASDQFSRDRSRKDGLNTYCRPCLAANAKRYAESESGRESSRRRTRKYYEANLEACAERTARWREKNPDYSAEANRKWREANPGAAAAYHQANREKTMERVLRRRKRLRDSQIGPVDLPALWEQQRELCGICGISIDRSLSHPDPLSPSIDHIVPLSKGGRHCQDNLQWTHLRCNLSKGAQVASNPWPGDGPNQRK